MKRLYWTCHPPLDFHLITFMDLEQETFLRLKVKLNQISKILVSNINNENWQYTQDVLELDLRERKKLIIKSLMIEERRNHLKHEQFQIPQF